MILKINKKYLTLVITLLFIGTIFVPLISSQDTAEKGLPRIREGGTPYNPNQSLQAFAIENIIGKDVPTSGLIESPPEYGPTQGVIYCFISGYQDDVVTDLVVSLTQDDEYDEIAYVWVSSVAQQNAATSMFSSNGANMSKVEFIVEPINSIWMRDYGPHFIWQNKTLGIVDSHYYPTRPLDNFAPTLLGDDHFIIPTYDMGLYYSGGNFQPGPNRSAYVSALVNSDNPSSGGFNSTFIAELYQQYQGIDTLHVFPQLPSSVDGTGHIDMWMYIVDEDTVIISEFQPGSDETAIQITNDAVPYMEGLGFEVYRTPAWNVGGTHYTYTNSFRVNDRIFIPYYRSGNSDYTDEDAEALANFTAAVGSGVEVIEIDCYGIIPAAGAIHCIVMQVPRYIESDPSAHVIWPDGGELLTSGTTQTIKWSATDTYNGNIPQIDLYYSTDGGDSYTFIDTTTNTGYYDWIIPSINSVNAKIKVVATASDSGEGIAESNDVFEISQGVQTVYDFSTNAGVDRFCWGHQTNNWNSYVDGVRKPVSTEIDTLVTDAYEKIAYSDATGGDSDSDRYISPDPSMFYESTHIYEFTIYEDPSDIRDIEVLWEGYADYCTQMELYVWDYVEEQWSDGALLFGQNRFMDNWAGNRDDILKQSIRSDFENYIDGSGILTLLLYAERGSSYYNDNPTFHDYISVTVTTGEPAPELSFDPTSKNFGIMYENSTDTTSFDIWNSGAYVLNYSLIESCSWVELTPTVGNSSGEHDEIIVEVNTTGLALGPYHCDIEITSNGGNDTFGIDLVVAEGGTEILDISQEVMNRGLPIRHATDGDWAGGQNFTPTVETITRAELYVRTLGWPDFDFVMELREETPDGTLIDTITIPKEDVSDTWMWLEFDFIDITVTPDIKYCVVVPSAPSGITNSFGYEWGYGFGDLYGGGSFWFNRLYPDDFWWMALPNKYELTFRVYGYS